MLKELKVGNWTINDLRGIFSFLRQHGGRTFGTYNIDPARYANKKINSKYYGTLPIKNEPIKYITVEEFRAGKSGYILVPWTTELRTPQI